LADYVIERHYPDAASAANPYLELLRAVTLRQASLIAGWMNVGFIHGVMNTDNMAISGETIDFGPCAFMDAYDPAAVFSSIDHMGRYAYANQPAAAHWNLARFAETMLRLIDDDSDRAVELATGVIAEFSKEFDEQWLAGMRRKLGLFTEEDGDLELIRGLLDVMHRSHADFTLTFRGCARPRRARRETQHSRGCFPNRRLFGYGRRLGARGRRANRNREASTPRSCAWSILASYRAIIASKR
jgi:uncharacterized protein YdiU (UPF0061 family)